MIERVIEFFAQPQNGILGIIVIVMGWVVWWQQNRIDKKDDQINALQKQLKDDADGNSNKYVETVKEVIGTQKDSVNAITLLQRSIDALTTSFQTFINGKGN